MNETDGSAGDLVAGDLVRCRVGNLPCRRESSRRLRSANYTPLSKSTRHSWLPFRDRLFGINKPTGCNVVRMDTSKAVVNLKKHRVGFEEACTVFDDPLAAIFRDEDHSIGEAREIIIGNSILGRLVLVYFTERSERVIRIFSARLATKERDTTMKTISDNRTGRKVNRKVADLKTEYKFDYANAQPNRFAGRREKRQVVVLLDPDVARVFTDPAAVNTALGNSERYPDQPGRQSSPVVHDNYTAAHN